MVRADTPLHLQVDSAALAELKAERDVADRKVESLQMTLAALKDDHERLKGAEASLKAARANLKDREEKLRAMSKQLEAARCALRPTALHTLSCVAGQEIDDQLPRMHEATSGVAVFPTHDVECPSSGFLCMPHTAAAQLACPLSNSICCKCACAVRQGGDGGGADEHTAQAGQGEGTPAGHQGG